jgi:hypothetical protein
MKKVLLIAATLLLLGTVLSSCKTHERCPAYSKTTSQTTEKPA